MLRQIQLQLNGLVADKGSQTGMSSQKHAKDASKFAADMQ